MKIAVSTPGAPRGWNVYVSSGSEVRWALNWMELLRQQGHEVVQVDDFFSSSEVFDLYFHTTKHADVGCGSGHVLSRNHVHLAYGVPHQDYLRDFSCYASGKTCYVAFPHRQVFDAAEPTENKYGYRRVFLPTPYPESLRRSGLPGVERKSITWMLKRVWHDNPNSAHEFRLDSYRGLGIWTLEAIRDLSKKTELSFNYVEENDYGQGVLDLPPQAARALGEISGLNFVRNQNFLNVLNLMAKAKLAISIGGLTGSAVDAVFCGAVPLAYTNPLSFTEHVIVPLTLTTSATAGGFTLPMPKDTRKEDIVSCLEKLWLDRDFYLAAQEKYLADFADHTEATALACFEEFRSCLS